MTLVNAKIMFPTKAVFLPSKTHPGTKIFAWPCQPCCFCDIFGAARSNKKERVKSNRLYLKLEMIWKKLFSLGASMCMELQTVFRYKFGMYEVDWFFRISAKNGPYLFSSCRRKRQKKGNISYIFSLPFKFSTSYCFVSTVCPKIGCY